MANIIKYDPSNPIVADRVIKYIKSANTPEYQSGNYLINSNLSAVSG